MNTPVPRHPRRPQRQEGRPAAVPQKQGPRPGPEAKQPQDARGAGAEAQRPRQEARGERSLYDGGSPSANRLGPAKAMRARDVSRPRD